MTVPGVLTIGRTYEVVYTIDSQSGPVSIRPLVGVSSVAPIAGKVGINRFIMTASGDTTAYINSGVSSGGTVRDISFREIPGNHATQSSPGSCPIWQGKYGAFDGIDDSWTTSSIDFSSTDKVTVVAGVRKASDANPAIVCEFGPTIATSNGAFYLSAPNGGDATFGFAAKGTALSALTAAAAAPFTAVLSGLYDIGGASVIGRLNGAATSSGATLGSGNFGAYPLNIGRRNNSSLPLSGSLFGMIVIGRLLEVAELAVFERYMARQAGVSP